MGTSLHVLGLVLLAYDCLGFASAALFLSIDCGTTSSYADPLGFNWVGDAQYTQTGQNAQVRINNSLSQSLNTLRYFPSMKKNCYTIPGVGQGNKILLRAGFYYGNYDGLSSPPAFRLQFDGNDQSAVNTSLSEPLFCEIIYVTKVDNVSVCVAQTQPNNIPFISSLELRALDSTMYGHMDNNYALFTRGRPAYGAPNVVRYPDDPYDRLWIPQGDLATLGLTALTSSTDPVTTDMVDKPPPAALRQAITPSSNLASSLSIPNPITSSTSVAYYVNMYFFEVSSNGNRSFTLLLDNQLFYAQSIIPQQTVLEIYTANHSLSSASVLTLARDAGSMLPPIINAAEFYKRSGLLTSGTDGYDVKALAGLQQSYVQLQAWSGDPCLPAGYAWDWLDCSSDPTPRVTELHLSGYGLNGSLPDFSGLTALQIIDLHNNSLSGSIPDFPGNFPNLKELNLADNHFSGSLPPSLTHNPKINLNTTGNNLSNSTRKVSSVGLIVGATLGPLLLLALLIGAFCIFRRTRASDIETIAMSSWRASDIETTPMSRKSSMSVSLTWEKRLQIALSVATGLDYLHSGCRPPIIHRDVKATNILLNEKLEAKVADFGLSKVGADDDFTHLSTVIAGTPGYIDPEYSGSNILTKKSDVYSFGVVLFEIMSGRPPIFTIAEQRHHIVQWAVPKLKRGDIHSVADPLLRGQYNVNSMWKVADIAMSCTSHTSNLRPTMNDVMKHLEETTDAETHQGMTATSSTELKPELTSANFSSSYEPFAPSPAAR